MRVPRRGDGLHPGLVVVLVALLTACSGITFGDQGTVDGAYTLRSVNSLPLPLALDDRPVQFTVTSGELTLGADGNWSETLTGTAIQNGQPATISIIETGEWRLRNPNVELTRFDGAIAYSGQFSSFSGPKLELRRPVRSTFT